MPVSGSTTTPHTSAGPGPGEFARRSWVSGTNWPTPSSSPCGRTERVEGDLDEPAYCSLGRESTSCRECREAVARKLVGRDIVPDLTRLRGCCQQIADEIAKALMRVVEVLTRVDNRGNLSVVGSLEGHERVGLDDRFEPIARVADTVADLGETGEVVADLTFMPRSEDGLDVREVLVQRRPAYAGLLRDLRHRHRRQPMLANECHGRVQGGVAHGCAVCLDRLRPQLGHETNVHSDIIPT